MGKNFFCDLRTEHLAGMTPSFFFVLVILWTSRRIYPNIVLQAFSIRMDGFGALGLSDLYITTVCNGIPHNDTLDYLMVLL